MQSSLRTPGQGDLPASVLYERHAATLFAYLRMHAPSLEDAEDLLLEVFLAALEWKPLLTLPEGEQLAWLRRVAYHKLADHYRRARRQPSITLEQVGAMFEADEALEPEQVALRQEERRRLGAALSRLSDYQQQVLRLRFGDGLRCTEIATLLGKREDTVRKLLSRTLNTLRALYGER